MQFVLSGQRLTELMNSLIAALSSKNEKIFTKTIELLDKIFNVGGQNSRDEFEKAKGLDLLE